MYSTCQIRLIIESVIDLRNLYNPEISDLKKAPPFQAGLSVIKRSDQK
jgi:hypothetical protein